MKKTIVLANYFKPEWNNIGGTTLLSSDLRSYLQESKSEYSFFDFSKSKKYNFVSVFNFIWNIPYIFRHDRIILMVSKNGLYYLFPVVDFLSRIFSCDLVLRCFGGNLDLLIDRAPKILFLELRLRRISTVFVETKFLVNKLNAFGNLKFLPNTRRFENLEFSSRLYSRKFVYIGRVNEVKGVNLLAELFDKYLPHYHLDIFGVIESGFIPSVSFERYFRGPLPNSMIIESLRQYDFLVLLTQYEGEGYPGVIIESYAAGTPVIASNFRAIPEIVLEGETGFLVDPLDPLRIAKKILSINQEMFYQLQVRAFEFHKEFKSDIVYTNFF